MKKVRIGPVKNCSFCHSEFRTYRPDGKTFYCSRKCHDSHKADLKTSEFKTCSVCEQSKPRFSSFHTTKTGYSVAACNECRNKRNKLDYQNNIKKYREDAKERWINNGFKAKIKQKYGLDIKDYNYLLTMQDNKCAICGSDKPGAKCRSFPIDHDHKTNMVRGLLCTKCNHGLGMFLDNPKFLRDAATYIEMWKTHHEELLKAVA